VEGDLDFDLRLGTGLNKCTRWLVSDYCIGYLVYLF
jgi:hypothetical protein